jgi:hypothetical protein
VRVVDDDARRIIINFLSRDRRRRTIQGLNDARGAHTGQTTVHVRLDSIPNRVIGHLPLRVRRARVVTTSRTEIRWNKIFVAVRRRPHLVHITRRFVLKE